MGICIKDNKILMGRRDDSRESFQDAWEFPGGKTEANETDERALNREFIEELGTPVIASKLFDTIYWEYSNGPLEIKYYTVRIEKMNLDEMELNAHRELRWFSFDEALKSNMLPANIKVVERLQNFYKSAPPEEVREATIFS